MIRLRIFIHRLRALFFKKRQERELEEEIGCHLEMQIEDNLRLGMSPDEARYEALRKFGGVEQIKEVYRDRRSLPMVESTLQDLQHASRMFVKSPVFTAIVVLTLALGIGANTAIFSVVNAVLLRPLPYIEPERLVMVNAVMKGEDEKERFVSYPDFFDWREQNQSFEEMASFRSAGFTLTGVDEPERVEGARVSANFFTLLRIQPILGRAFLAEEEKPSSAHVVIVSYSFWQQRLGGDRSATGRTLTLNGTHFTVIGVLPPNFSFPLQVSKSELWATIAWEGQNLESRGSRTNFVVGRLKPGVPLVQAQTDMQTIASRLESQYADSNANRTVRLIGLHEKLVGNIKESLWVLFGAVGFVLLIACANVANLLLARATARQKELAIRSALGASRWRVMRQLLTESVLLAMAGGTAGLLFALCGVELLSALAPEDLLHVSAIKVDGRALFFTLLVSLLTGIFFGLAPALKASRIDLNEALKDGSYNVTAGIERHRLRGLLVVSEMALALILLVGAGLLIKSFIRLQQVDPGFRPENVLTMRLNLTRAKYGEGQQRIAFFQEAFERIEALPGVESAALITPAPFTGDNVSSNFAIKGQPLPHDKEQQANVRGITPKYFRVLGIPLIKGREFTEQDRKGGIGVAIINEALAGRYFPQENPLGQRITGVGVNVDDDEPTEWEIVGVVGNVHHFSLDTESAPELYLPHQQQTWNWGHIVVRTNRDPMALAGVIRRQILSIDKDQPVAKIQPLEQMISQSVAQPRFYMALLTIFAAVGLALAMVGIYGVIAFSVIQRTHEIGIRMALGAQSLDVLKIIVGQAMILTFIGVAIGLVGAFVLTRLISSLLFGISPTDPATFGAISVLLTSVALLASSIPALKATKVSPIIALRND
jgi:predicted permease